uniref:Tachykinin-like peptides receptor 99D-like n=1 Tax=Saccoglossus kowalevskii TaxID=10224 RepID=A0ABM0MBI6_SACKO|nr:PREDICTED: tachykinin-like peptides receptor 99D-like [Saccoglossus kowalevskii]
MAAILMQCSESDTESMLSSDESYEIEEYDDNERCHDFVLECQGQIGPYRFEPARKVRDVVKMMILVVVIFATCWLPVHIYFLLGRSYSDVLYSHPNAREIYMAVFWLGMSNSMYNPFIYCWLNDRFRRGFRKALRWLPCFKWAPGERVDSQRPATLSGTYSTSQGMKLMRNGSEMTTTVEESMLENKL